MLNSDHAASVAHLNLGSAKVAIVGGIWDFPTFYQDRMVAPESVLADGLEATGLDIHRFGHLNRFRPSMFDIVHIHFALWGVLRMLEDRSDARFVYTNHLSVPLNRRAAFLTRAAMNTADRVVAMSRTERRRIEDRYGVSRERSVVIANGTDASVFAFSQPTPPKRGRWRLLFVGQLIPMKAVGVLLEAIQRLREELDLHLELVYQNASLEAELRQRVRELNLDERVTFTGLLHPVEVARRMKESHILVLPSITGEEFPAVVTQALMCGRQVVTTDIGSIREQLGGFGVIVAPGDSETLAGGIARAIKDYQEFCDVVAERAHESAIRRFSIPAMIQAHIAAYQGVVEGGRPLRASGSGRRWSLAARLSGAIYRPFANHPPAR
jgi:glycosyltransferase involved in cell wall biosynthesis